MVSYTTKNQWQSHWVHDDMTDSPGVKVSTLRLSSIDAFRGLVMFLMTAEVLESGMVVKNVCAAGRGGGFWKLLLWQQSHVEWVAEVAVDRRHPLCRREHFGLPCKHVRDEFSVRPIDVFPRIISAQVLR